MLHIALQADVPCPVRGKHRADVNPGHAYANDIHKQLQNIQKEGKQVFITLYFAYIFLINLVL